MQALALAPRRESTIGPRLARILKERRWSLHKLSARSGVSASQLSLLTRGIIGYPRVSTIRAICRALEIDEMELISATPTRPSRPADLQAYEGITLVPVVKARADGTLVETGEAVPVALTQLNTDHRLFVAVVGGGGMAPHVLIGDRILFDPRGAPESEQVVLLVHDGATLAAWRILTEAGPIYWCNDGSRLPPERVIVLGTVCYIMRLPPTGRCP